MSRKKTFSFIVHLELLDNRHRCIRVIDAKVCVFVCVSIGLKKPGDFTVTEGHRYPLVDL
jgi:hypothetical protein